MDLEILRVEVVTVSESKYKIKSWYLDVLVKPREMAPRSFAVQVESRVDGNTIFYQPDWQCHSTDLAECLSEALDYEHSYMMFCKQEELDKL